MPIALPAIDLAALCGVLMLLATLIVLEYTFKRLADVLNFSVLGVHPLKHVATAIESTIVAGCNIGIKQLDKWAIALWHGLEWAWNELMVGVSDFVNATDDALHYLRHVSIPALISVSILDIKKTAHGASSLAGTLVTDLGKLDNRVTLLTKSLPGTINSHIAAWWRTASLAVTHEINTAISALPAQWRGDISSAIAAIPQAANTAASTLTGAAEQALTNAEAEASAARRDVKNLLNEINPTDIAATIGGFVLLRSLVNTLESETGLENESCRQKIKGICATDPGAWANLLSDLAPFAIAFSLRDIVSEARPMVGNLAGAIREIADR